MGPSRCLLRIVTMKHSRRLKAKIAGDFLQRPDRRLSQDPLATEGDTVQEMVKEGGTVQEKVRICRQQLELPASPGGRQLHPVVCHLHRGMNLRVALAGRQCPFNVLYAWAT